MFKRPDKYLLTHYPLLWNTKAITVVAVSLAVHLLFFIAGFAGLDIKSLGQEYYSFLPRETTGMFTMSFLFSVMILIAWLVFFLRNNAFKEFYIIEKHFLAKQFLLVSLIVFVSSTFFHSYRWGIEARARSFTSRPELIREANLLNLAAKFLPHDRSDYFKLNKCSLPDSIHAHFESDYNYFDTTLSQYNNSENKRIREVLNDSDAFLYETFCKEQAGVEGSDTTWSIRANNWINNHREDSIRYVLTEIQKVATKYNIDHRLHVDSLVALVFADSLHTVTKTVAWSNPDRTNTDAYYQEVPASDDALPGTDYIRMSQVSSALLFIDRAYTRMWSEDEYMFQTVLLYVALCLGIVLLCYRIFTKKVFLISLVGTIVWTILLVGIMAGSNAMTGGFVFLLLLCFLSWLVSRAGGLGKTSRGVLLTWHVWLVPFVVLILLALFQETYNLHDSYRPGTMPLVYYTEAEMKSMYPVGYWITHNTELLARLNLLLVIGYVAFIYTRMARNWHTSPEE